MYRYFELILAMGTAWALSGMLRFMLPDNRKNPAAPYAVAVIVVFLLGIFDNLLRPHLLPIGVLRFIYPVTRLSYFLVGPALWIYIQSLLMDEFKISWKTFLHLIPFVIWFIYVLIDPVSLHPKIPFGENPDVGSGQAVSPILSLSLFWDLSGNLSRLIYSVVILVKLKHNSQTLPDRVSNITSRNTLSWLGNLIIFYVGIFLINSLLNVVLSEESQFFQISSAFGRTVPAVLFVFLFSLYSEKQPVVAAREDRVKTDTPKYEKSGISETESKLLYSDLYKHIENTKAYVDPELTLAMLAEQMGETRHRLSEVINRESGKRFFSFINDFRLKEFKDAVKTNRFPDYTIIAIAFECGFRSSSAFYSMVKKEIGMTPKEFVSNIQTV